MIIFSSAFCDHRNVVLVNIRGLTVNVSDAVIRLIEVSMLPLREECIETVIPVYKNSWCRAPVNLFLEITDSIIAPCPRYAPVLSKALFEYVIQHAARSR